MVNSIRFDSTVNAFGNLVNEVFSGTNEKQKVKLRGLLKHFNKFINGKSPRARNCDNQLKIIEQKKMPRFVIHDILPPEMVEKILKFLNYKDIFQAQLICKRWKEIIDNGNLVKNASSKSRKPYSFSKTES